MARYLFLAAAAAVLFASTSVPVRADGGGGGDVPTLARCTFTGGSCVPNPMCIRAGGICGFTPPITCTCVI